MYACQIGRQKKFCVTVPNIRYYEIADRIPANIRILLTMHTPSPEDGPLYRNQPLREAAFEIAFRGNLAIEAGRSGFQEEIRDQYPNLLVPQALEGVAPSLQHYRFENEDRDAGVQLAINSFSFYMKRYPGAHLFKKETRKLFDIAKPIMRSIEATRVGWRYINIIPFLRGGDSIPLDSYFSQNSIFGHCLRADYKALMLDVVMPNDDTDIHVKLGTSVYDETQPELGSLILDIDAFVDDKTRLQNMAENFDDFINLVHGAARGVFESFISDSYRKYLKGDGQ